MQSKSHLIESIFKPVVGLVLEMFDKVEENGRHSDINECLSTFCKRMLKGSDLHSCFVISAQGIRIEELIWQPVNLSMPCRENSYESIDLLNFHTGNTAEDSPVTLSYNYTLKNNIEKLKVEIDNYFFSFSCRENMLLEKHFRYCEERLRFLKHKKILEERIRKQRGDSSENDINYN